ncbi:MAG: hypothetical protein AB1546_01395 [bacterium]
MFLVERLRGWNRLSGVVERSKIPQPKDEYRFERRNRYRITKNYEPSHLYSTF